MHVATIAYGRNCNSANQIERIAETAHIHEQGQDVQGSQINQITDPQSLRNRCCPYDFDSKLCQVINDRVLCGYNRNIGMPARNDRALDLSGGCRLRGGRLECGYEQGPFTNARRPPGWDETAQSDEKGGNTIAGEIVPPVKLNENETLITTLQLNHTNNEKLLKPDDTTKKYRPVTKCVEIHERVVCKPV